MVLLRMVIVAEEGTRSEIVGRPLDKRATSVTLCLMRYKERITITVDPDILTRLDALAEARGENRSAVVERMLRVRLEDEEQFVADMENPLKRAVIKALTVNPAVLDFVSSVMGEEMTAEQLQRIRKKLPER